MEDKTNGATTLYKSPSKAEISQIIDKYIADVRDLWIVGGFLIGVEEGSCDQEGRHTIHLRNIFDKDYLIEDFTREIFVSLAVFCAELQHRFSLMGCSGLLNVGSINPSRRSEWEEHYKRQDIKTTFVDFNLKRKKIRGYKSN